MAEELKRHLQVMNVTSVISIGEKASQTVRGMLSGIPTVRWSMQCNVPVCDATVVEVGPGNVFHTCVTSTLAAADIVKAVMDLKPSVQTLVLLDDDCEVANQTERDLRSILAPPIELRSIPIDSMSSLALQLAAIQNLTDAFVLLPSYECIPDASAQVRGVLCVYGFKPVSSYAV
eukprot:6001358-Pyramimonas_sp.AAC.1